MNASFAHRLLHHQDALITMSAPKLLREPLRPPVMPATAKLAQSLSLRELVALASLRREVRHAQ